eukprot:Awhi_evm1s6810
MWRYLLWVKEKSVCKRNGFDQREDGHHKCHGRCSVYECCKKKEKKTCQDYFGTKLEKDNALILGMLMVEIILLNVQTTNAQLTCAVKGNCVNNSSGNMAKTIAKTPDTE